MDQQREQGLESHVTQRRQRVSRVRDTLGCRAGGSCTGSGRHLRGRRRRPAGTLVIEGERSACRSSSQADVPACRGAEHDRQNGEDGDDRRSREGRSPERLTVRVTYELLTSLPQRRAAARASSPIVRIEPHTAGIARKPTQDRHRRSPPPCCTATTRLRRRDPTCEAALVDDPHGGRKRRTEKDRRHAESVRLTAIAVTKRASIIAAAAVGEPRRQALADRRIADWEATLPSTARSNPSALAPARRHAAKRSEVHGRRIRSANRAPEARSPARCRSKIGRQHDRERVRSSCSGTGR